MRKTKSTGSGGRAKWASQAKRDHWKGHGVFIHPPPKDPNQLLRKEPAMALLRVGDSAAHHGIHHKIPEVRLTHHLEHAFHFVVSVWNLWSFPLRV